MFKAAIKGPVKAALKVTRKAKNYIQQIEEEPKQERNYDQDDAAYPWLNDILKKLLAAGGMRPNYTWGVLHAAHLSKVIGVTRMSAIEFGVAGGNGLVSLERIAETVGEVFGVRIDVYGFDTGAGLPEPHDYRDLPNLYTKGGFPMDVEKLKGRLKTAQLIIGLVEDTILSFIYSRPSPVGFISFDLDYYTSTIQALNLLEADQALLLPRVHCYFDDIMGFTCSEYNGERLAIAEFNVSHTMRKLSPIYGLKYFLPSPHGQAQWAEMFYMAHIFDHELYGRNDGLVRRPFDGTTALKTK
jgi:hypothetical protein